MSKWLICIFTIIFLTATAIAPLSCKTNSPIPSLTSKDEAVIYATVIRQLVTVDDTFGGTLKPSKIFIIRNTDDKAGSPMDQHIASVLISQATQNDISEALRDLPTEIMWINQFKDAEFEEGMGTGLVKDRGAIITLGNIHPQDKVSVQLAGSIYVGNVGAGGATYTLKKVEGEWKITGTTGPRWIS